MKCSRRDALTFFGYSGKVVNQLNSGNGVGGGGELSDPVEGPENE